MRKMLFILSVSLLFLGCKKTDDGNGNTNITVVPITPTQLSATVISTTQINLTWTDKSTNEVGFKIQRKTGSGNFADVGTVGKDVVNFSNSGLTPATTYTYRVYAYNSTGASLSYTNEVTVTTFGSAILTTTAVSNISNTSAQSGGTITSDGGSPITARGVVWSTSINPTITLTTKTSDGTGTGVFTSNITGLAANTTYYVRAYATNSAGTAYGDEVSFAIVPGIILSIDCSSAINNGVLTAGISASGVSSIISYVGGNGGPYVSQSVPSTGVTGLIASLPSGSFVTGASNLTYSIVGTPSTSGIANFVFNIGGQTCTLSRVVSPINPGSVTDISSNTYPTVVIGTQVWMAENLRTTRYRDGSNIPIVTDWTQWQNNFNNSTTLPMMCWQNNDQATYTANKFGALYNWYAINPATNGNKNVCPTGWHIPTDAEWTTLMTFLGGESAAGGKMKSTGTQYWKSPNTGATNSSGWSGLPGGSRNMVAPFYTPGWDGTWWSSTDASTSDAWFRFLSHQYGEVYRYLNNKTGGFSVRCIKD